jgi:soluble lytic murein transglycosylase-like protein
MIIESNGRPNATSSVGARGLMQVMPAWSGHWRDCGRNLYEIEANLCAGTNILAWYLRRHGGDERRALLGYNGCVTGSNTPNCHTYPDKIAAMRRQVERELEKARARTKTAPVAAAP